MVKNVTAHYRPLEGRDGLRNASCGRSGHFFVPDPQRGFERGSTGHVAHGRQTDIGAFDSPKHARDTAISRKRDMARERQMADPSAERLIGVALSRKALLREPAVAPIQIHRTRPAAAAAPGH